MKNTMAGGIVAAAVLSGCTENSGRMDDAMSVIARRVSVRSYDASRQISDEVTERLLRAAMAAPTALNLQPWEFIVVKDGATLEALAKTNRFGGMIASAPLAIVVCGDTVREDGGEPNKWWMLDCSAATENLLLAASAEGLGAVWTAVYPHEDRIAAVREILGIPDRHVPLCIVPIGHPAGLAGKPKDKWKPEKIHRGRW